MSFGPVNFDNPAQCVGSSYLVTLITGEQCEHSEQALYSIMICVTICRELKFPAFTQAVWGDGHTPQFKYHNIYSFLQKTSPTCITHIENCRANCRTGAIRASLCIGQHTTPGINVARCLHHITHPQWFHLNNTKTLTLHVIMMIENGSICQPF